ncbi:alpha/beta hydrolase family protein [Trinickia sp. EG282A]|uniref:alpha/beta hydrolase family protein n=1 Tax=Trinickia sp. EG282A TaxID=3237013 RepID=UPI0034D1ACB9
MGTTQSIQGGNDDAPRGEAGARPDQRLSRRYRFGDADMDLFFMSALSWGPTGGLDIGQAFHVASTIVDGDADSWVSAFAAYGHLQTAQADAWARRGWRRAAGEARLKAFASYRSAWQFAAAGGDTFSRLYRQHQTAFAQAMGELAIPTTFFNVPFGAGELPGLFVCAETPDAPVVLVIGGADTSLEDLFLSVGRSIRERGYAVAIVDLPGQGNTAAKGLHWQTEPEHAIRAVVDHLVQQFDVQPGRILLLGLSLGGYFVTRAAGYESRFAAVIASTPFPEPGALFGASVRAAQDGNASEGASSAALRSRQMMLWKAGAASPQGFIERWRAARADPARVTLPFLSIVGLGDSPMFIAQARDWHERIASTKKDLVELDAATGADGHCQVNARLRLVQEVCGWIDELFQSREPVQAQGSGRRE